MPVEIEAKMKIDDVTALETRLTELGAARGPDFEQTNCYFDTPDGRLRKNDQALRIRIDRRSDRAELAATMTHKGPRLPGKVKARAETELPIDNADAGRAMLEALGFVHKLNFAKRRRRWHLDGCLVEIDTLPQLGDFVEIEGPHEPAVLAVKQRLGLAFVSN